MSNVNTSSDTHDQLTAKIEELSEELGEYSIKTQKLEKDLEELGKKARWTDTLTKGLGTIATLITIVLGGSGFYSIAQARKEADQAVKKAVETADLAAQEAVGKAELAKTKADEAINRANQEHKVLEKLNQRLSGSISAHEYFLVSEAKRKCARILEGFSMTSIDPESVVLLRNESQIIERLLKVHGDMEVDDSAQTLDELILWDRVIHGLLLFEDVNRAESSEAFVQKLANARSVWEQLEVDLKEDVFKAYALNVLGIIELKRYKHKYVNGSATDLRFQDLNEIEQIFMEAKAYNDLFSRPYNYLAVVSLERIKVLQDSGEELSAEQNAEITNWLASANARFGIAFTYSKTDRARAVLKNNQASTKVTQADLLRVTDPERAKACVESAIRLTNEAEEYNNAPSTVFVTRAEAYSVRIITHSDLYETDEAKQAAKAEILALIRRGVKAGFNRFKTQSRENILKKWHRFGYLKNLDPNFTDEFFDACMGIET